MSNKARQPATWKTRWTITGILTTRTPLHIGDGGTRPDDRIRRDGIVQVATVTTDGEGKPYIPGSTLKGNLRSWMEANGAAQKTIDHLLGTRDAGAEDAVGGKCVFHNARYWPSSPTREPSLWLASRCTGIRAGVAINRVTGTAEDKKLFHHEYVPPGIGFKVTVTGQDLDDDEVAVLLGAFEGFNPSNGRSEVTLGAATGDGWGRLTWKDSCAKRVTPDDVKQWLEQGRGMLGGGIQGTVQNLVPWAPSAPAPGAKVELELTLNFDGPFLVNDPSRCGKGRDLPDHAPLLDDHGRAFLPASSIRGALRSQAERILRTIGGPQAACCDNPAADGRKACKAVYDVKRVATDLCLACQLFGAPGWKSPLAFSDFTWAADDQEYGEHRQHFVAIDRFTGGAAEHLKFDSDVVLDCRLTGALFLDLEKFGRLLGAAALGLLTLTLKDLFEGDVSLGMGSAKGFGSVRATLGPVTNFPKWTDLPASFREIVRQDALVEPIVLDETRRSMLSGWVADLEHATNPQQGG